MLEILFVLILLLLLFFAIPIRIGASGRLDDVDLVASASLRLALGAIGVGVVFDDRLFWKLKLFGVRILIRAIGGGTKETEKPDEEEDKKEEKQPEQRPKKSLAEHFELARCYYRRFSPAVYTLLRRLLKVVWVRRLEISGQYGAGSPDATGRTVGYAQALRAFTGKRVVLDLQPNFLESGFKGSFRFEIWFWLGFLLFAVVLAALSIGFRFGVWYLQGKLSGLRRSRAQAA